MKRKLRVVEAFSGIGSQTQALKNIEVDHEVVATIEWDINAIKSYYAIHCEQIPYHKEFSQEFIQAYLNKSNLSNNGSSPVKEDYFSRMNEKARNEIFDAVVGSKCYGSLPDLDVDDIPDHDLFTYSFPCQDISLAGKQNGLDKSSGTRSSLLWYCRGIIAYKKPKYLLMENVKNLVGKKHKHNFDKWLEWLEEQGYTNYWKVLNAKDYGIPQNRERVFVVSILGEHNSYEFPTKQKLQLRLKDMLEDTVDDNFYVSDEKVSQLLVNTKGKIDLSKQVIGTCHPRNDLSFATRDLVYNQEKISPTITSTTYKDPVKIVQVGNIVSTGNWGNPQRGRIYSAKGISPSLNTVGGGGLEPKILVKNATKKGYLEATVGDGIDLAYPSSNTRRGRVQKGMSHTLQTSDSLGTLDGYRIRKLTPMECWKLMGFTEKEFTEAQKVNSNTQLYKQAGNSIVVDVLEGIFKNLLMKERKKSGKRRRKVQRNNKA